MSVLENCWPHCLTELERRLGADQFRIWIKPLTVEMTDEGLNLIVPNQIFLQFIRDRYLGMIEEAAASFASGDAPVIALRVGSMQRPAAAPQASNAGAAEGKPAPAKAVISVSAANHETTRLNPNFTFETLVTGKANQLARAAAIQVAENPGVSYNPLFVYGGVGLGKTHLIQSIGNYVHQRNPGAKIRYIHAEKYVQDVVRAYQHKAFDEFKRYYHSLDLLLIDDIQFFVGKDKTQEEFFYAFNALVEAHKQIIITSDRYPKEIDGLQERLTSRFSWGLTVAIEPPELEMRVAILMKKAERENFKLDANVAFFVAKHIRSNVRELEGALKRVLAYSRFTNQPITLDAAKEALKDILASGSRQVSVENIQKTVADFYKIKIADMHSKKRTRDIARPRQIAMALTKELTQMSLPAIGEAFGGRDHTTVLHACRTIEEMRGSDSEIAHQYGVLLQMLRS
ncbi:MULTISPECIES: chromosomal replication initiator protein DnaA [Iodobacter]|uniref:Chromosomal replication initiator protein DnaA n=2 Tax=Iodobacter TaxID=32014 RepID=A0A377SUN5_9NEIS|nr:MULTISPECIES: chromosomal replication initiator protein DnaA [Iodobacter]NHQ87327.1 chromosomal replication initiator protein DnaA [Iodobacter violacea]TCU85512.1 chromosomal replication initiator protein DnaA [Iodobacter fluviatilis]STR45040.1 Chromosomal replication initiator protein DnaA [Iodobacter fluviatilis]